jgi:predicted AAA+ superfamily ATPase
MQYYPRHIEAIVKKVKKQFPVTLITGPRQVGKSTLLRHISSGKYEEVSFDDPIIRLQAENDPNLFMKNNPPPIMLDEIQYVPGIFPYLKMSIDKDRKDGDYLITGSQAFVLMKNVSESLAGRVAILELQGVSLREANNCNFDLPFIPTEDYISKRANKLTSYENIWHSIHRGYMPELVYNPEKDWEVFYSSYVQTYIERDVKQLTQVADEAHFLRFMIAIAARSGELINYDSVARDVGVSSDTIKRWLSILQTSRIIYLLEPYHNNQLKRSIKTPKVYFLDTGLLAYLTRWPTPETLANGAKAGNVFETFVISEIIKSYINAGKINLPLYFYRDRDGREIDLVIESADTLYPVEIKMTASPQISMAKNFGALDDVPDKKRGLGVILCQYDRKLMLSEQVVALPIEYV